MNKVLIALIGVSLTILTTMSYFYYRDVVIAKEEIPSGCAPYNLKVSNITKVSAEVSWETGSVCSGFVKSGLSKDLIDKSHIGDGGYVGKTDHSVTVENLRPETIYYLSIFSNGELYGINGQPVQIETKPL